MLGALQPQAKLLQLIVVLLQHGGAGKGWPAEQCLISCACSIKCSLLLHAVLLSSLSHEQLAVSTAPSAAESNVQGSSSLHQADRQRPATVTELDTRCHPCTGRADMQNPTPSQQTTDIQPESSKRKKVCEAHAHPELLALAGRLGLLCAARVLLPGNSLSKESAVRMLSPRCVRGSVA